MGWVLAAVAAVAVLMLLSGLKRTAVQPGEVALLYRDGVFVRELGPGAHRWFDLLGRTSLHRVSLLPRALSAVALDVITKDQFAFRIVVTPMRAPTAKARGARPPDHPAWPPTWNSTRHMTGCTRRYPQLRCMSFRC